MLNPIYNYLVVYPAVQRGFNNLGKREINIDISEDKVVFTLYDQERRQYKTVVVYIFNRCRLFPIIRLKLFVSSMSINTHNDYIAIDNIYYKTRLVEIIEVCILNRILRAYIGYQPELRVYKFKVFVESSLEVVDTWKTRFNLKVTVYKVVSSMFADGLCITRY